MTSARATAGLTLLAAAAAATIGGAALLSR